MSDAFSKIFAIILAVSMMYIVPVFYMREETDRVKQTYVLETVISFVDGVRNTGILGQEDYNRLVNELGGFNDIYTIELTHCTHSMDDLNGECYYFADEYYNAQIFECFERGEDYYMLKTDYLKVVVKKQDGAIMAWYGGSIRNEAY